MTGPAAKLTLIGPWLAEWVVDSAGVITHVSFYERALKTGATPDVIAGVDILTDDGYPYAEAVDVCAAAHRTGRDAEAFARHFVKLRKAFRGDRE